MSSVENLLLVLLLAALGAVAVQQVKLRRTRTPRRAEQHEETPLWAVIIMAALLLPLAAAAFTLSFQMIWPVMILAGWSVGVAWLGPVLVDIAAGAGAFMQLAVRNETVQWSGRLLLAASTALSIAGNLAGHAIEKPHHSAALPPELSGAFLPHEWSWVVQAMSIAAPVFVAGLVHAFGHVLVGYMASRARVPRADGEQDATVTAEHAATVPAAEEQGRGTAAEEHPAPAAEAPVPAVPQSAALDGDGRAEHPASPSGQPRPDTAPASAPAALPAAETRPAASAEPPAATVEEEPTGRHALTGQHVPAQRSASTGRHPTPAATSRPSEPPRPATKPADKPTGTGTAKPRSEQAKPAASGKQSKELTDEEAAQLAEELADVLPAAERFDREHQRKHGRPAGIRALRDEFGGATARLQNLRRVLNHRQGAQVIELHRHTPQSPEIAESGVPAGLRNTGPQPPQNTAPEEQEEHADPAQVRDGEVHAEQVGTEHEEHPERQPVAVGDR